MPSKKTMQKKIVEDNRDYKTFAIEMVSIIFGKLVVLENTKLSIEYGEHYGLVGKNGIGKTSLLTAIANKTIEVPSKLDIIYVKQEEPESDISVLDTILSSDEKLYTCLKKLDELEKLVEDPEVEDITLDEYNLLSRQIGSDGTKAKAYAQKILYGLGFLSEEQQKKVSDFSGGWRMRISLAKALFMTPTMLILDEPTNHLDLHANIWLTSYLKTYPKTLLVVSHDKYFIDEVCTTIIHIENKKLNYYKGNYDKFQKQLTLERDKVMKDWKIHEKKIETMRKSKKSPQNIQEYIKSKQIIRPEKDYTVKINFLQPNIIKGTFISLENITFGYENQPLIYKNLDFNININSRIAIVGKNGTGKSTLLKLIIGNLEPIDGEIIRASSIKIGYYNQHFEESMPFELDPVEYLMQLNNEIDLTSAHKYLSMFGLESIHHKTNISSLSGGQKARVKFASFGVMKPHILVLDEPTNHLDIVAIESLINALNNFEGAIILVTHNFDMITRINSELWALDENGFSKYLKNYENYVQQIYDQLDC